MENIKNKYIEVFFKNLTIEDKEEIYFNQYMWHAFSYEKLPCIEGLKAINEFKQKRKNDVYLFFEKNDIILEMKNITYDELIDMITKEIINADCYIVDKNFKWSFIYTHETVAEGTCDFINPYYIGPFFITVNEDYKD